MKTIRELKIYFLMAIVVTCNILLLPSCEDKQKANSFRFVFMTDIHVQPELRADEGFRAAIAKVNELKPDFVITGGDLIMDALGQTEARSTELYDLFDEISKEFKMPVYHTIGNHEVFGLYKRSGISPDHPEYGKEMYKKRLGQGKTYYSFDHKGWHFVMLDAIGFTEERKYIGDVDSVQLEWLKADLARIGTQTPVVISTHIPLISVAGQMKNGGTAALSASAIVTNSNSVIKQCERNNLKLVLQGHLHIVEEIIFRDTHFITGGAVSGNWWKGLRDGFPEGFVVVDVSDNTFTWRYETFGWQAEQSDEN